MTGLLVLGLIPCVVAVSAGFLVSYATKRWAGSIRNLTGRLEAARMVTRTSDLSPAQFDSRELELLPPCVQRYFRTVLDEGQPIVSSASIDLSGSLNLSPKGEQWKSFTSQQRVVIQRPGFLWNARVSMLPGVTVRVVDSYIAGTGLMHASILGLYTVGRVGGDGEIARGELMRFFAEAVWYPTALLPGQGVRWDSVDAHSANATIADGPLTLTLLFRFNGNGLVDSVRAESRGYMIGEKCVMMPWECSLSDYEVHDGMTVPGVGEAAWIHPEGRRPYFRGTVTSIVYEFVSR